MQISISEESLTDLKNWFTNYVHTFQYNEPEKQQNIDLKKDHTLRVCKEISNIGNQLGLNDDQLRLAEIIALLHDIGRFEQYARYYTFRDRSSENHAELGIRIIEKFGLLESLDNNNIKSIILCAIKYHNRHSLPLEESEELAAHCIDNDIDLIFLIAPTTIGDRLEKIITKGTGFLYLVSRLGVTGVKADVAVSTKVLLDRVKTDTPKAVGFGISSGMQAKEIVQMGADGVIVGSALVDIIASNNNVSERLESLTREIKSGLKEQ